MRSLKSTKRPASRKDLKHYKSHFRFLICNAPSKHIKADSLQWATSHPDQHVVNHSVHFIGMPKGIRLWEVQSNVIRTFVTMNGEVQKYHRKFCLVPIHF